MNKIHNEKVRFPNTYTTVLTDPIDKKYLAEHTPNEDGYYLVETADGQWYVKEIGGVLTGYPVK